MSSEQDKVRIGITVGDPAGIGIETIIKVFSDSRMVEMCCPIIYGNSELLKQHRRANNLSEFKHQAVASADEARNKTVNVINVWESDKEIELGVAKKENGTFAFESLKAAVTDLASNKIDALVTAPINKDVMQSEEFDFPGHTEYLASMSNVEDCLMFLVSERMRIGVATGHVPIKDVASNLSTESILKKLDLMHESLLRDFGVASPKIAVLGLNPHAGDNGLLGEEEKTIIQPAIRSAQESGKLVYGPYGADGFFGTNQYKHFDATLAMYHDQGLAPFKALAFEDGVNFTAGLPIVRTSPDHGTAYDLAGKGEADPSSMRHAVYMACDIYKNRKEYKELSANPLQKQQRDRKKEH
jgi:4-hydroxythreonine-4-phosphate dehydrogenase